MYEGFTKEFKYEGSVNHPLTKSSINRTLYIVNRP